MVHDNSIDFWVQTYNVYRIVSIAGQEPALYIEIHLLGSFQPLDICHLLKELVFMNLVQGIFNFLLNIINLENILFVSE